VHKYNVNYSLMSLAVSRWLGCNLQVYNKHKHILQSEENNETRINCLTNPILAYWKNKPSLCGLAWRDTLVFAQGMNKIWFFIKTVARRPAKQQHIRGGGQRSNRLAPETLINNTALSPPKPSCAKHWYYDLVSRC